MSLITFYGNGKVETAQTTSMAAIGTYIAMQQQYKVLLINTKHNDMSLQECLWDTSKVLKRKNDLGTGINGLVKAISSNKISPEIITNYTKVVFNKGYLEVLTDDKITAAEYERQKEYLVDIAKLADRYYDLVFLDVEGDINEPYIKELLSISNLIVANTSQRIKVIKEFIENIKIHNLNKNKIIMLLGKYDGYSKYNIKNVQRLEKIEDVYGIPYNTAFFEKCNEGELTDFMINYKYFRKNSIQAPVMESISKISNRIIDKLKELQMNF